MDNQSNPMGLLAPFVAAMQAALQEMVTKAVDEALTARAGAANAAALLDDALDERIRTICLSVVDGAIESHNDSGFHPTNDDIREVIDNYDFSDKIDSAIDGYDFSDALERALERFDFGDKVAEVINNGSFDFTA